MKVYRVTFHDADEGAMLSWHATKVQAHQRLKSLQADSEPRGVERVDPVEIPTTKASLLDWLNMHFTRDNG